MRIEDARRTENEVYDVLVFLALKFIDHPGRTCCDGETTLADWIDCGLYYIIEETP